MNYNSYVHSCIFTIISTYVNLYTTIIQLLLTHKLWQHFAEFFKDYRIYVKNSLWEFYGSC